LGRLDDLVAASDRMLERGEQTGDRLLPMQAHHWYAAVALARGRYEEAKRSWEQMVAALPEQPAVLLAHGVQMFGVLLFSGQSDQPLAVAEMISSATPLPSDHLVAAAASPQCYLNTPRAPLATS